MLNLIDYIELSNKRFVISLKRKMENTLRVVMNNMSKFWFIEKRYLVAVYSIIIITTIISIYVDSIEIQMSNNVTLAVEIGIGITIAIVIYGISRKSEAEMAEKMKEMHSIINEQKDFKKKETDLARKKLMPGLRKLNNALDDMLGLLYKQLDILSDENSQKDDHKEKINKKWEEIKAEHALFDNNHIISPDYLDVQTMHQFVDLSRLQTKPHHP